MWLLEGCAKNSYFQPIVKQFNLKKTMEGFLHGPPRSFNDYVSSLHCIPVTGAVVVSLALHLWGAVPVWPILGIFTGCAVSGLLFMVLPLPILQAIGGRHNVGLVHLDGRRSHTMPPLAVFYPTDVRPTQKGVPYVPFGDVRFLHGISSCAKVPLYILKDTLFVRLRVSQDAAPISLFSDNREIPPPIIVFSHGLVAHYRLYSCLMADLAARGAVVVSIGHCDGSASFMLDSLQDDNGVHFKHLGWDVPVREAQLAHRVQEVRQTLKRIAEKDFWRDLGFSEADIERYFASPVRVHLSGHSFGGATALAAALQENQETNGGRVQSVCVFDPWGLPIQNEHFFQPIENGQKKYMTPSLMIQSEDWVNNKEIEDFFQRVTAAVLAQPALASLSERERRDMFRTERFGGTSHHSVCDVCVLSPFFHGQMQAFVPPRAQIVDWSNTLLHFTKQNTPQQVF